MSRISEAVAAYQEELERPVTVPQIDPQAAQVAAMFLKMDERGKKTAVRIMATLLALCGPLA